MPSPICLLRFSALSLLATTSLAAEEHSILQPVPGSVAVSSPASETDGELVVTYREGGGRERRTLHGRLFRLEYDVFETTRTEIVEHYQREVERLEGTIHRETENQLTFQFVRADGGDSWAMLWATDGNYTLEILDEPAPQPRAVLVGSEDGPTATPAAQTERIPFPSDHLPPGAGAVLDRVADRLLGDASLRARLSGSGASVVARALALYGIEPDRLDVEEGQGAVEIEIVPGR